MGDRAGGVEMRGWRFNMIKYVVYFYGSLKGLKNTILNIIETPLDI